MTLPDVTTNTMMNRRGLMFRIATAAAISAATRIGVPGSIHQTSAQDGTVGNPVGSILSNYAEYAADLYSGEWEAWFGSPIIYDLNEAVQRGYVDAGYASVMGNPILGYFPAVVIPDAESWSTSRLYGIFGYAGTSEADSAFAQVRAIPPPIDIVDYSTDAIHAYSFVGNIEDGVSGSILIQGASAGPFLLSTRSAFRSGELTANNVDESMLEFGRLIEAYEVAIPEAIDVFRPVRLNSSPSTGSTWARVDGTDVPLFGGISSATLFNASDSLQSLLNFQGAVADYPLNTFIDQRLFKDEFSSVSFLEQYEENQANGLNAMGITLQPDESLTNERQIAFFVRWVVPGQDVVYAGHRVVSSKGTSATDSTIYNTGTPYELDQIDPSLPLYGPIAAASAALHEQLTGSQDGPVIQIQL